MSNDIGGVWRTIAGRRVFIKNGQNLSTAMKESGKFNNKYKKYYTKQLDSIVMQKYTRTKKEKMYVYDANNWFWIENHDYGEYNIKAVLRIEGNEEYIKTLSKEIDKDE